MIIQLSSQNGAGQPFTMMAQSNTNKTKQSRQKLKAINVMPPIPNFSALCGPTVSGVVYELGEAMLGM
jgi:hypothetical protein